MPDNVYIENGDLSIDTSEKSLIKINSTSYNVYDAWFEFIKKYFGVDDSNDPYISLLKTSFFGYFNEIVSSEIKNAVFHRNFLYDEHFLNTATLPESIFNFAKLYNVPIELATPATMYVSIAFKESQLIGSALLHEIETTTVLTNDNATSLKVFNLTLDREETLFTIDGYKFMLPYSVVITVQEYSDGTHGFSAMFDTTANSFPPLEEDSNNTTYIKTWREKVDGSNYFFISLNLYQLEKTTKTIEITNTSDSLDVLYNEISYKDQLSYFEVFYEYKNEINKLNLYYNNIYTPTDEEYYGYYNFLDDSKIQLSFSYNENSFRPVIGSSLMVNTYTTLGVEGNFDYSGSISMSLGDQTTFEDIDIKVSCIGNGSSGGEDNLDTYGQKIKIIEQITTRNNLITDNDLIKFFDSINETLNLNGSTIKFIKKQDDVLKRIYCNFLLLRDENQRVIPTNTAPKLIIPASELTGNVIKEHSIVECNYIRDIQNEYEEAKKEIDNLDKYIDKNNNERLSQDYIEYKLNNKYFSSFIDEYEKEYGIEIDSLNSIYNKLKLLECKPDMLVYSIPFMIKINKEPFLNASYFNLDINKDYKMNYSYINNNFGNQFSISNITIEKNNSPDASNKYTLESNIYNISFKLNTNVDFDVLENVVIKCNVYSKDYKNKYGFFLFTKESSETDNSNDIVSYNYTYTAQLATNYEFLGNKLCLYNSLYNMKNNKTELINKVFVEEDLEFKIGIMMYDKGLAEKEDVSIDSERYEFRDPIPMEYFNSTSEYQDIIATVEKLNDKNSSPMFSVLTNNGVISSFTYEKFHDFINIKTNYKSGLYKTNNYRVVGKLCLETRYEGNNYLISTSIDLNSIESNYNSTSYKNYSIDYNKNIFDFNIDIVKTIESIRIINRKLDPDTSMITYSLSQTDYNGSIFSNSIINSLYTNSIKGYFIIDDFLVDDISKNLIDITISNDYLNMNSIILKISDDEINNIKDSDIYNIQNYALLTSFNNNDTIQLYQNLSKLMNSIVTYDSDKDEYTIELVPLVGLRYYMARPSTIYDLINQFINVIDINLPRLENNTTCDLKFYNTYGPSRYFYLNKEIIESTVYKDTNNDEIINEEDIDDSIMYDEVTDTITKFNYLGRTDIILDFTIYLYESITESKDKEIKKFISDYVENCNEENILPISNLITQLEQSFPIIKFIRYNGIFSDIIENNDTSKNNDYQLVDNDFDFNNMTKEEIIAYVPEYLNLKKDVINTQKKEKVDGITESDIMTLFNYESYDYVISIKYKN